MRPAHEDSHWQFSPRTAGPLRNLTFAEKYGELRAAGHAHRAIRHAQDNADRTTDPTVANSRCRPLAVFRQAAANGGNAAGAADDCRTLNSRSGPHCGHSGDSDLSRPMAGLKALLTFQARLHVAAARMSVDRRGQLELSEPTYGGVGRPKPVIQCLRFVEWGELVRLLATPVLRRAIDLAVQPLGHPPRSGRARRPALKA